MMHILSRIIRFIEIDINLLTVDISLRKKLNYIVRTNITIFSNIVLRPKSTGDIYLDGLTISYDTPYATKTFLAAIYDLYLVSLKGSIFKKNEITIVDVGGNIGQFACAAKVLFPKALVYSFEPDEQVFSLLKKNLKNFSKTKFFNFALSNKKGKATFYVSKEFSEWSSLKKIDGHSYNEISIESVLGDDVLKSLKEIDLLKIDVEGAELQAVLGLKKTLKKVRYLLIEVSIVRNKDDIGSSKLLEVLLENNFAIYHVGRIFSEGVGREQGAIDILFKNTTYSS